MLIFVEWAELVLGQGWGSYKVGLVLDYGFGVNKIKGPVGLFKK